MNLDSLLKTCAIRINHARMEWQRPYGSFTDKEYVLHFAIGGICSFWIKGELHRIRPGDAVLMPPHTPHTLRPQRRIRHYVIHFTLPFEPLALVGSPFVVRFDSRDRERMQRILDSLLKEWHGNEKACELAQAGLMAEALALYVRNSDTVVASEGASSKVWKNVEQALRIMHRHYREPLTLEDLCEACGLSAAYLCRSFTSYTGFSPMHFLNRVRIQKAKELLRDHQLNCTEVAEQTGFSSIQSFSKVFRREEGLSPSQWARQALPSGERQSHSRRRRVR